MKREGFIAVLERCESLACAIEEGLRTNQSAAVEAETAPLSELLIHLQRGLAPLSERLAALPGPDRADLADRVQSLLHTFQRVNATADLLAQDATARLSVLASAMGTALSYRPDGQLDR